MLRFEVINKLLLLYLIERARNCGGIFEDTRLQKLVFLSERSMLGRGLRGFTYVFIRLLYGPFSRELDNDKAALGDAQLIDYSYDRGYYVSEKGAKILSIFGNVLERNRRFIEIIDDIVERFTAVSLDRLLAYVYDLPRGIRGDRRRIGLLPIKTVILARPKGRDYIDFDIRDNELWELSFWMDPDVIYIEETHVRNYRVLLLRYREDKYWSAVAPSLLGCVSQGGDKNEAITNIGEAIEAYMEET